MSYVVFARRFRPQSFDDIIGQEHISKTLKNAIKENRVAHAYIFSGPRGVGKTTTARILAKALNCKNGPTDKPCGTCPNCLEIVSGASVDVQEIDGASNRGIDEIRALRDNVRFAPAASKYKIYIIDEAHQITDAAFNALLKTLEEPPSHVVFILATTESQKIPITILSRCQRYRFRFLSSSEIMDAIGKIVKSENVSIEEDAMRLVTEAAGGSLRDALSLLDQVISFVGGNVKAQDVQNLLGFLPKQIISSATSYIHKQDNASIMSLVKQINDEGFSLMQFARDLREHFRKLMLFTINPSMLELTAEEKTLLESQKDMFPTEWFVRSGRLLSKLLDEMRWSDQPRLVLELYMLKIAQPYAAIDDVISRIEKLENGSSAEEPDVEPDETEKSESVVSSYRNITDSPKKAEEAGSGLKPEHGIPGNYKVLWADVVNQFRKEKPMIGNMLADVSVGEIAGSDITIYARNKFQEEGVKRSLAALEELASKRFAKPMKIKVFVGATGNSAQSQSDEVVAVEAEVSPIKEMFEVQQESPGEKQNLPPDILKITSKIPGKVTKRQL